MLAVLSSPAAAAPIQRVVPYTGHLDSDGVPFDGEVQMTFTLYDTAEGPQAAGQPWSECHPQVRVRDGAFTVRLGAPAGPGAVASDLTPLLARDEQQYLAIAVRPRNLGLNPAGDCAANGGPWTAFGARQAISPVPQALWSARATDLVATSVTAEAVAAGTVSAGEIDAAGVTAGAVTTTGAGLRIENGGTLSFGPGGHINGLFQVSERVHDFTCAGSIVNTPFGNLPIGHSVCNQSVDVMAADGRSACFLAESGVQIEGDHFASSGRFITRCWVSPQNGRWVLGSYLDGTHTKANRCVARCLTW
jgi:hypothetical protein